MQLYFLGGPYHDKLVSELENVPTAEGLQVVMRDGSAAYVSLGRVAGTKRVVLLYVGPVDYEAETAS